MQDPHPAHSGVYDPVGSATYCTKGSKQKLGMWRARTPPYTYSPSFFGFQLLHTPSSQPMRVPSLASFVVFFGLLPTHLRSLTQTLSNCRFCSLILAWLPAIVPSASCPIWRRVVSFLFYIWCEISSKQPRMHADATSCPRTVCTAWIECGATLSSVCGWHGAI